MKSARAVTLPKAALMRSGETSGNGYIIAITLAAMCISVVSMYSVIIVMFGMLPGLIAMIVDQEPRRYISRIVLTFNATGVAPYIAKVLSGKGASNMAIEIIIDPRTWLMIYTSATIGWLVYWGFPQAAIMFNNIKTQIRLQKLNYDLDKLVEEWGDDIKSKKN